MKKAQELQDFISHRTVEEAARLIELLYSAGLLTVRGQGGRDLGVYSVEVHPTRPKPSIVVWTE